MSWRSELESWLAPFLEVLQHKTRARMCPAYVAGLIGAGDRKSVQPMAARDHRSDTISCIISSRPEFGTGSRGALLKKADGLVGDKAGFLVIDDTTLPKKGCHSVGVAPQYASSLGKTANCQSLVSVTLARARCP